MPWMGRYGLLMKTLIIPLIPSLREVTRLPMRIGSSFSFFTWSKIKFCITLENGIKREYIEIKHDFDKSHDLSIEHTNPRHESEYSPRIYPNPNDPLCPYKYLSFYCSLCPPHQERVFCMLASDNQIKKHVADGNNFLYNPKRTVSVES
jgi:hypothetical protein